MQLDDVSHQRQPDPQPAGCPVVRALCANISHIASKAPGSKPMPLSRPLEDGIARTSARTESTMRHRAGA
ncbi:hypothetical protein [Variovorax sp. RCC_210]|uniref:hypothetical protein n=1 Tax=Variovorax sp. RCC_210 TaxID=3239217 RepID=UPI003524D5BA